MNRSKRGAARVSAVWMIVVIVAFFVAVGVAFVAFDEAGKKEETIAKLQSDLQESSARYDTERTTLRDVSQVAGFYDREAASERAEVEAMKAGLTSLRDAYPDIDPAVKTFQDAVPVVITAYNARGTRIRDLETQVAELQAEVAAKDKTIREVTSSKDQELAQARSQIQDLEQAMADQKTTLEKQVSSQRAEVSDRDAKLKEALSELDEKTRTFARERETDRTRMADMSNKLKFLREPEAADGSILAVDKNLALAWIDRGAHDRLARGTRFRVVSGATGSNKVKAWAEVTKVEPDMAEVRIFDQKDPFDPPVAGDIVYNPVYDPTGQRNAVLAGRFSGTFNEQELRELLRQIGITVQPELDLTTDYLIVGQELYTDPETLEPLEEPLQPSELAVYKDAVANGLAIIPIKDIRQYFKN